MSASADGKRGKAVIYFSVQMPCRRDMLQIGRENNRHGARHRHQSEKSRRVM